MFSHQSRSAFAVKGGAALTIVLMLAGTPCLAQEPASAPPAGNEQTDPKNWKSKKMSPGRGRPSSQTGARSPGK